MPIDAKHTSMNWLSEWKALSAQIKGIIEAARFYIESNRTGHNDSFQVAREQLVPQITTLIKALTAFRTNYKDYIPVDAAEFLIAQLQQVPSITNRPLVRDNPFVFVHVMGTVLASFHAGFEFYISDTSSVAKRLSERAFIHLQRSIVADTDIRRKWKEAFDNGEAACEKLGAVHLLLHGIWAFKVNAEGERTDLVFDDPLPSDSSIERSAESLVLTEWKFVERQERVEAISAAARKQAARYTVGALGGLELARYRLIVLVSKKTLNVPVDVDQIGVIYRHVNIAVDPQAPSEA